MKNVADPEIVIGIVGRMGVNTLAVGEWIDEILHSLHYKSSKIKLTDYLQEVSLTTPVKGSPIEERYKSYIAACNEVREKAGTNEIFASYAIQRIIGERTYRNNGAPTQIPVERTAYIIDQIKRPEEAEALRRVYGQQFVLVSCHMPIDTRIRTLAAKIAEGHASEPKSREWLSAAQTLIETDEKESSVLHGQRVSDVFPLADLIIDATTDKTANPTLRRFFEALFGNFKISPTRPEFYQNLAYNVSLTRISQVT